MDSLVLIVEYDYQGTFGGGKVLGTFDAVSKVNDWCRNNIQTATTINFVSTEHCPSQSIYFRETVGMVNTDSKLTLSKTEHNPITLLGQVRDVMEEQETLLDLLQARDSILEDLTSQDDELVTVHIRDIARSEIFLDFRTWGISLLEDGTWHFEDTLGLQDGE